MTTLPPTSTAAAALVAAIPQSASEDPRLTLLRQCLARDEREAAAEGGVTGDGWRDAWCMSSWAPLDNEDSDERVAHADDASDAAHEGIALALRQGVDDGSA